MDNKKKSNIAFVNELKKNEKFYKLYPRKIVFGNFLIFIRKLKKLLFRKNKFPIFHAIVSSIIFSKPELKNNFFIKKYLYLLIKFSKYPFSLIYQKNNILELKFISDKLIKSDIKNKILTDRISFINIKKTKVHKSLYPKDLSEHIFLFPGLLNGLSFTNDFIKFISSRNATIIFPIGVNCEEFLGELSSLNNIYITRIEDHKKYSVMQKIIMEKKMYHLMQWVKLDCGFEKLKIIEEFKNKKFKYVHKMRVDMIYFQPHYLFSNEYKNFLDDNINLIAQGDLSFSGSRNTFAKFEGIVDFFFEFFTKDPYAIDKINVELFRNSDRDAFAWHGLAFSRKMLKSIGENNPEYLSDNQLYDVLSSYEFEKAQESLSYLLNSNNHNDKYIRYPGFDMPPEIIFAKFLNFNNIKVKSHDGILGRIMR